MLCTYVIKAQFCAFYECPRVNMSWVPFGQLKEVAWLSNVYHNWESIPFGDTDDVSSFTNVEEGHWDKTATFPVSDCTPWDIFCHLLSWNIWCLKISHDIRQEPFQLGVAFLQAWQTTMHVGMATRDNPPCKKARRLVANQRLWTLQRNTSFLIGFFLLLQVRKHILHWC